MKKLSMLAMAALVLLSVGSFGSVAFAKESGNSDSHRSENSRSDKRADKKNDSDRKDSDGTTTDNGTSAPTEMTEGITQ